MPNDFTVIKIETTEKLVPTSADKNGGYTIQKSQRKTITVQDMNATSEFEKIYTFDVPAVGMYDQMAVDDQLAPPEIL